MKKQKQLFTFIPVLMLLVALTANLFNRETNSSCAVVSRVGCGLNRFVQFNKTIFPLFDSKEFNLLNFNSGSDELSKENGKSLTPLIHHLRFVMVM
ncbi:hypothetical protein CHISP_1135 [Chitinispirillum alkaliphilum]|nr:hypothetical protein CHISP_1135 [Chitinispirillum alkaliphilum]